VNAALANHLWQSTACAALVWALTWTLRRHRASLRYALWLAASLKFLLPFALLTALGTQVPSPVSVRVSEPLAPVAQSLQLLHDPVPAAPAAPSETSRILPALWLMGFAFVAVRWLRRWHQLHRLAQAAEPLDLPGTTLPVRLIDATLEPGVFGFFRPVLLLPRGLPARLSPAQLRAVLDHELMHVRRRDNLTAALHMAVEAVFWFHPLVWWIGRQLIHERERACDEAVLHSGSRPADYAQSIVNVSKFYLESPLACSAGITGSDLLQRIESIMNPRLIAALTPARKFTLAAAAALTLLTPVFLGVLRAQEANKDKLTFEVATIKPHGGDVHQVGIRLGPGGSLNATNVSLKALIAMAYDLREFQISGGPAWVESDRWVIQAKGTTAEAEAEGPRPQNPQQRQLMRQQLGERLRHLLAERFQLQIRREKKEAPVYALVTGKDGHKMKAAEEAAGGPRQMIRMGRGEINGEGIPMALLAENLARITGRPVLDKTGLNGPFIFKLEWTPEGNEGLPLPGGAAPPPPASSGGPSIFHALQEQLGLKLESQKGEVDALVIVKAEKPGEN